MYTVLAMAALALSGWAPHALAGDSCSGASSGTQLQNYCDAGKANEEAADANKSTAMVYTGAAALCTTACAMQWNPSAPAWEKACNVSSVGAAGYDFVKTKEFTSALGALGSFALQSAASKSATGVSQMTIPFTQQKVAMSCISAGMHAVNAYMKNSAAEDERAAAKQNFALAQRVTESRGGVAFNGTGGQTGSMDGSATGGSTGSLSKSSSGSADKTDSNTTAKACSTSAKTGDFQATIECAVATDPKLAGMMGSEFGKSLQAVTGMNPSDFFKKVGEEGPSGALGGALGAQLNAEGNARLSAILKGLEARVKAENPAYARGSGGGGGGSGGPDPMDQMMASLMGNLLPKDKQEQKTGVGELAFQSKRFPANVAEDRRVSIFERITSRYHAVSPRVLIAPAPPVEQTAGNPYR
ncbi:MAG: hypothetical protein NDJ90_12025 [Oligoflexia bacterium]|nr:hypothetical protein [Oligoflexia bacterium]